MTKEELKNILLEHYGIVDAESFLSPQYILANPFLFRDMEKSVDRIKKAIDKKEHIGIYADYDCDGIPGAVILLDLFKKIGTKEMVHIYIPDRHEEGYGVSSKGIETLISEGVTLIITVDVGITAIAEIASAMSQGVDVVVTDHHGILAIGMPAAFAIVHPEVGDYPNKGVCGAGVAFHLVRAFIEKYGKEYEIPEGFEKWSLDLVGFATLSDMVSLTGENRILVYYGMMVMKKTKRVGLQILFQKNNIYLPNLVESDLTFTVAPRLNAASRMDTPMLAFDLLSTDDEVLATAIVTKLDKINTERKTLVARIVKSAHTSLEHRELNDVVVVGNPEWRPAVLGLVANKLEESYGKSFFVWGEGGDGSIKGSCRMIDEHHASLLFQALPDGLMIHAGGHQAAGGFSISKDKVHFLEEALNKALKNVENNPPAGGENKNEIEFPINGVNTENLKVVRNFAPFGIGHSEPNFVFKNVLIKDTKKFGKNKEHMECTITDGKKIATAFMFFANDSVFGKFAPNSEVNFFGSLEAGWRGGVRVRIKDVI